MNVYIVQESYSDYDEGYSNVISVHLSSDGAHKMRNACDMACEMDYLSKDRHGYSRDVFLWGEYYNYSFEVIQLEVLS